jgi:sugar phosphate isomerase/epimerase
VQRLVEPQLSALNLVGYCTNVHPGHDLETTRKQLDQYAVEVRRRVGREQMGVGLWLSRATATELLTHSHAPAEFAEWLSERGLIPYTLNGFPFGNFHSEVVKHQVYEPTWADPLRLQYTVDLAEIFAKLLQATGQKRGSISTLPLGWAAINDATFHRQAAEKLQVLAEALSKIEERSGCRIEVCLEPEPGCTLGSMPPMIEFFQRYLLTGEEAVRHRNSRYLSVCYDICHSGVMHESSATNVRALKQAGIRIGKVQVSSALEVQFERLSSDERERAWERLSSFMEPRYLHQTVVYRPGREPAYFEDLPLAMNDADVKQKGCWTVHFHVPISESTAGELGTTQASIFQFIEAAFQENWVPPQWEVETYAWNVLPPELRADSLAAGISQEVVALEQWLAPYFASRQPGGAV